MHQIVVVVVVVSLGSKSPSHEEDASRILSNVQPYECWRYRSIVAAMPSEARKCTSFTVNSQAARITAREIRRSVIRGTRRSLYARWVYRSPLSSSSGVCDPCDLRRCDGYRIEFRGLFLGTRGAARPRKRAGRERERETGFHGKERFIENGSLAEAARSVARP